MNSAGIKTITVLFLLALPLGLAGPAGAQKVYRIGSLNTAEQLVNAFEGFKSRMVQLGYVEGKNVRYDFYNAKGNNEALNAFAKKLAQDKVDMIVTSATSSTVAAAKATKGTSIPVVFLSAGNPEKLVKSFAGSGSNLAGISSATLELTGKRLELLKEMVPSVNRITSIDNPGGVNFQTNLREFREGAKRMGFTIREIEVRGREEIQRALPTITAKTADAIFTPPESLITEHIEVIATHAIKNKLPVITSLLANVKKGCLATYAADYFALGRQGAVLADKIFKGTKPANLPIELPSKLSLVINLKTAKAIGLKVPREILLRADEVIQ